MAVDSGYHIFEVYDTILSVADIKIRYEKWEFIFTCRNREGT